MQHSSANQIVTLTGLKGVFAWQLRHHRHTGQCNAGIVDQQPPIKPVACVAPSQPLDQGKTREVLVQEPKILDSTWMLIKLFPPPRSRG